MSASTKDAKAKTTGRCYATAIRKACRRVSQIYDDALEPCGLKTTQRAILAVVERSGSLSVRDLANALVMDAGGLAHTLKPLVRDGYISIDVDPSDRRSRLISLESAGIAILRKTDAPFEQAQARFENAFGKEEAERLRDAVLFITSDAFLHGLED